MSFLIRKRLRLSKWLSLNVSKSGLGLSVGPPGAKLSLNPKRARVQLGIPGTGIGYRKDMSLPQQEPSPSTQPVRPWLIVWLLLLGLLLVWLFSGCGFTAWRDQMLRDVRDGRFRVDPSQVGIGSQPSHTIGWIAPGIAGT